jgi:hypothetical protein
MNEIVSAHHLRELASRETELRFREEYDSSRRLERLERTLSVSLARLGLRPATGRL